MNLAITVLIHLLSLLLSLIAILLTLMVIWRTGKRLDHFFKFLLVGLVLFVVASTIALFEDIYVFSVQIEEIFEAASLLFIIIAIAYIHRLIKNLNEVS